MKKNKLIIYRKKKGLPANKIYIFPYKGYKLVWMYKHPDNNVVLELIFLLCLQTEDRPENMRSQGINESANFRFLQRLSVIFGFHGDCPDFLLPVVLGK